MDELSAWKTRVESFAHIFVLSARLRDNNELCGCSGVGCRSVDIKYSQWVEVYTLLFTQSYVYDDNLMIWLSIKLKRRFHQTVFSVFCACSSELESSWNHLCSLLEFLFDGLDLEVSECLYFECLYFMVLPRYFEISVMFRGSCFGTAPEMEAAGPCRF